MSPFSAEILNYVIGICFLLFMIPVLNNQGQRNPNFKILGLRMKQFKILIYVAIIVYASLMIMAFF